MSNVTPGQVALVVEGRLRDGQRHKGHESHNVSSGKGTVKLKLASPGNQRPPTAVGLKSCLPGLTPGVWSQLGSTRTDGNHLSSCFGRCQQGKGQAPVWGGTFTHHADKGAGSWRGGKFPNTLTKMEALPLLKWTLRKGNTATTH